MGGHVMRAVAILVNFAVWGIALVAAVELAKWVGAFF
jgi:hypothetical protein